MKKKFILIFSMLALVACLFALSVSASNYSYGFDVPEDTYIYSISGTGFVGTNSANDSEGTVEGFDFLFGFSQCSIEFTNGETKYAFIIYNIEAFHEFVVSHNIDSKEEFLCLNDILVQEKLIPYEEDGDEILPSNSMFYYAWQSSNQYLFDVYNTYVSELNTPTYEQGKTDGVTEYKTSNEYYAELNKQYAQGKTEGVTAYKSSSEYTNAMNAKYATGLADGEANYIESDEYEEALQAEYDKGLSEAQADKLGTTLLSIVGSTLLGVAVVWLINRFSSKRRRRR